MKTWRSCGIPHANLGAEVGSAGFVWGFSAQRNLGLSQQNIIGNSIGNNKQCGSLDVNVITRICINQIRDLPMEKREKNS